jgi:YfiH family protein
MTQLPAAPGIYRLDCFGEKVIAGFSGREFPREKHHDFLEQLGICEGRFIRPKQEHTADILSVRSGTLALNRGRVADALVTDDADLAIGIITADCLPVYYADPVKHVIAIAHAGWRGVAGGLVGKTIRAMAQNYGCRPANIRVGIGPAIRFCCYEVGEELKPVFGEFYRSPEVGGRAHVDLIGAARKQLTGEGVSDASITDSGFCTACHNDRFYSARRDGNSERILSVIVRRP